MTTLRSLATVVVLLGAVLTGGCIGPFDADGDASTPTANSTPGSTPSPPTAHRGYEQTTVTVRDGETGSALGTVHAAVADNGSLRYTGLSETEALPENRGMLFVHGSEGERTYVMREMAFGIDIVFVDANRTITAIHHAPAPAPEEDGTAQRYSGTGRYVLEVNYGWTTERGVEVGDRLEFDRPG